MKTYIHHPLLLAAAVLLPLWASAQAPTAVPSTISYQGRVLDTSGAPVGAGTPVNRTVIFRIWDSASSTAAANLLYSESQTVTISDGEFSVLVGNGLANTTQTFGPSETGKGPPLVTLAGVFNGTERFLGVTVAGAATITTSDNEISPRQQVVGTAYAFRARVAESLSAGGTTALTVANGGNVGIGTTTPSAPLSLGTTFNNTKLALVDVAGGVYGLGVQSNQFRLHLGGSSGRYSFLDSAAGSELMTLTGTGNLGLGTSTPVSSLAYAANWKGMHINAGTDSGIAIVQGNTSARLHLHSASNTAGLGRDLSLSNENNNTAVFRWMNGIVARAPAIFTANSDGDMTFARNGTFGGALSGTSGTFSGQINVNNGGLTGEPTTSTLGGGGMRLILWTGIDNSSTPFGFGIAANTLFSVTPATAIHKWFGGTTERMSLNGSNGNLIVTGSVTGGSISTTGALSAASVTSTGALSAASVTSTGALSAASITSSGKVGIGTTAPKAMLHVDVATHTFNKATLSGNQSSLGVFLGSDGGVAGAGGASEIYGDNSTIEFGQIAALFEGETICTRVWFGNEVHNASDARAKQVRSLSDGVADLATVMNLRVTDYTWVDRSRDGHRPHKMLLAQEVQRAFPQAVSRHPQPQTVPSVYQLAEKTQYDAAKSLLNVTTKKPHGFQAGDVVDLYLEKSEMKGVKVESVSGAHEFTVKSEEAAEKVFVYGKRVNDFLTVDYDAISMLNVSATQQLKKEKDAQVAALEAENAKLSEKLAAQEQRLKALEAADKARDAKLAALERLLDDSAKPAARTVLLKKDTGAE